MSWVQLRVHTRIATSGIVVITTSLVVPVSELDYSIVVFLCYRIPCLFYWARGPSLDQLMIIHLNLTLVACNGISYGHCTNSNNGEFFGQTTFSSLRF